MKILILGKTGQLGRSWESLLSAHDGSFSVSAVRYGREDLNLLEKDIIADRLDYVRPDVIINCSAFTDVEASESQVETAYSINAAAPEIMARWCRQNGAFLLHYSTDYVFDGKSAGHRLETDDVIPLNAYGQSKLAGEQVVQRSGCRHLIFRISWLFSPYGVNFVKKMMSRMREMPRVQIVNDQFGCPTYAASVAELTRSALFQTIANPKLCGLYHLGGAPGASWYEFSQEIYRSAKQLAILHSECELAPVSSEQFPTKAIRPRVSMLNCDKFEACFSLRRPDWRSDLIKCLERFGEVG